ncbi:unnamed protein product, partial [Timema podura]|nr:unnamed protein product [Timema podura]
MRRPLNMCLYLQERNKARYRNDSALNLCPRPIDEIEKRKEEERKFGVFFDDDYNYLNHLFDIRKSAVEWESVEKFQIKKADITKHEGVKLQLPSSVFASTIEEDVGLLNLAAPRSGPQLDLDPDVVAALDDDFDFDNPDNQLEDDFMQLANTGDNYDDEISDSDEDRECLDVSSNADSNEEEDDDDVASLTGPQFTFADEETKSRFTNYSLSSSMFAGYDDAEIGALDCEEIEGYIPIDSDQVLKCAEEFERERATHKPDTDVTLKRLEQLLSSEDEEEMVKLELKQEDRFDCESILSTYSNLYNHPKLIEEPVYDMYSDLYNHPQLIEEPVVSIQYDMYFDLYNHPKLIEEPVVSIQYDMYFDLYNHPKLIEEPV